GHEALDHADRVAPGHAHEGAVAAVDDAGGLAHRVVFRGGVAIVAWQAVPRDLGETRAQALVTLLERHRRLHLLLLPPTPTLSCPAPRSSCGPASRRAPRARRPGSAPGRRPP